MINVKYEGQLDDSTKAPQAAKNIYVARKENSIVNTKPDRSHDRQQPPPHNTYHQRCGAGLYAAGGNAGGGGGDLRTVRLLGSSINSSTSTGSSRTTASSCSINTSTEVVLGNIVENEDVYGEGVGLATRRVFAGGGRIAVSFGTNWVSMWTWVTVRVAVSISVITAGGISYRREYVCVSENNLQTNSWELQPWSHFWSKYA
jgi:hypothetical protein